MATHHDPVDDLGVGIQNSRTELAILRRQMLAAGLRDVAAALYAVDALVAMLETQIEQLRDEVRGSSRPPAPPSPPRTSRSEP